MVSFKFVALACAALQAVSVFAQDDIEVEDVQDTPDKANVKLDDMKRWAETGGTTQWSHTDNTPPPVAIDVNMSFPDAEIFGVKMVNGRPTRALFTITNNEPEPINVLIAWASLLTPTGVPGYPDPPEYLRNLTAQKYGTKLPPASRETFTYSFSTIMQPMDLTLQIKAVVQNGENFVTMTMFSETVSVVEPPVSLFDPQIIFLYLFLLAAFGGTCYFIYTTWITTLFPQKRRGGKGGERAKRSTTGSKKVDPAEQAAVVGAEGPAVTSSSQAYDESWIPAAHLQRPQARRVGSGRPKSRAA